MTNLKKKTSLVLFSVGLIVCLICSLFTSPLLNNRALAEEQDAVVYEQIVALNTSESTTSQQRNLTAIGDVTGISGGGANSGYIVTNEGAGNGYAYAVGFHAFAPCTPDNVPVFDNPIDITAINTLTIRMLVHLSPKSPYLSEAGGVKIFALSANGTDLSKSIEIPADITQDAWIDFVLTEEEFAILADEDGMIRGLQFAWNTQCAEQDANRADKIYGGGYGAKDKYILIDTVTATTDNLLAFDATQSSTIGTRTITGIGDLAGSGGGANSGYIVTNEGAGNGYAYAVGFHAFAPCTPDNVPVFDNPIDTSKVESVNIRMLVHLSPKSPYLNAEGGVKLLALSATGSTWENYVEIPADITQDEWIDFVLTKKEFVKLADEDGMIRGLQFAWNTQCAEQDANRADKIYGGGYGAKDKYILIDKVTATPLQGKTLEELEAGALLLTAAEGWYTLGDNTLTHINGTQPLNGQTQPSRENNMGTKEAGDYVVEADGAVTGLAFQYNFHSWNEVYSEKAVLFKNSINVNEVGALGIRIKAHLSSSETYMATNLAIKSDTYFGIHFYGIGADGQKTGYLIPENIVQDEWVELILTKEELTRLATDDGNGNLILSGLQVCSSMRSNDDKYFYTGSPTQDKHAYILLDYVYAYKYIDVDFVTDENQTKTAQAVEGQPIEGYIPEKEGYVFCGWYNGEELFDFETAITEEITLTAKWEQAGAVADVKGLYLSASATGKYAVGGQYFYVDADGAIITSDLIDGTVLSAGVSKDGLLIVVDGEYKVATFAITEGAFVKVADAEVVKINYSYGNKTEVFYVKSGETLKNIKPVRTGCTFVEWLDVDGEAFDFATVIDKEVTLNAKWEYIETSENFYAFYEGKFYSADTYKILSLGGENKGKFGDEEVTYYILDTYDLIVRDSSGADIEFKIFPEYVQDANGNKYYRMKDFTVTFNTNGGSEVEEIVATEISGWVILQPEDPTKEGATFKGWKTADGQAFDFDTVINSDITLYAEWEVIADNTPVEPEKEDNTLGIVLGSVGGAVVGAAAALLVVYLLKKKK